jgi:TatD DNase family protein
MLIDTHAHLDSDDFVENRDEVIARAIAAGVERMIAVATNASSAERCIAIAAQHTGVFASVGIHPNYPANLTDVEWPRIVELTKSPKVVALGETGLDRHWNDTPFPVQQEYFDRHLRLSLETGLPVIIHTRECDADTLEMLRAARQRGPLNGVMHSFSGEAATAAECIELGLHISFAGMVTYKKNGVLREIAKSVPDDRILVETDCPYLSPEPKRGKRNEPANVVYTAQCVADVRGMSLEQLSQLTTANAKRLFRLP